MMKHYLTIGEAVFFMLGALILVVLGVLSLSFGNLLSGLFLTMASLGMFVFLFWDNQHERRQKA